MAFPTINEAEAILKEAEKLNPGDWILHNRVAASCARKIASTCEGLDKDKANVNAKRF